MLRIQSPSAAALLLKTFSILLVFFILVADSTIPPQMKAKCGRTCIVENCNFISIRYGKYCGLGWFGCPGEKPCDDLDACCLIHDNCVDKDGMTNIKCHENFKRCIRNVQKSGKKGFSKACPYDTAIRTMSQGMDLGILASHFGNNIKREL